MAWTVIVPKRRTGESIETHYTRVFSNENQARLHADSIRSIVDPSVKIIVEESGPFQRIIVACLICGYSIEAHETGIICPECARWAMAFEIKINNQRSRSWPRYVAVEIAAQQERRARL